MSPSEKTRRPAEAPDSHGRSAADAAASGAASARGGDAEHPGDDGEAARLAARLVIFQAGYQLTPYYSTGRDWSDYAPAYRYGWQAFARHRAHRFEDVEPRLRADWPRARGRSRLAWAEARGAVEDAWRQRAAEAPRTSSPLECGWPDSAPSGEHAAADATRAAHEPEDRQP